MLLRAESGAGQDTGAADAPRVSPRWYIWLAVLMPFVLLAGWRATQGIGVRADDHGQYLMHAQALAEGRPYSDIGYIYSAYAAGVGPRAAPPGLPLTITPVMKLFGPNMTVLKIFMLIFSTAFVLLAGMYFARHDDPRVGWGVALLVGLSPLMVTTASQVLTDLPFAAVVWLIIHLMDRDAKPSWPTIAAVAALGMYAVSLRAVGVSLVFALLLYTLLRFRELRFRPAVPVMIWAAALLLGSLFAEIGSMAVINVNPAAMMKAIVVHHRPVIHLQQYLPEILASHLQPFPWTAANYAFNSATLVVMVVGCTEAVRRYYKSFAFSFGLAYGGLLLIMPFAQGRYLWPLFPIFVFGLLNGLRVLLQFVKRLPAPAPVLVLVFASVLAAGGATRVLAQPALQNLEDVPEARAVIEHMRQTAAREPVRVSFFKPRSFAWITGLPAMGQPAGKTECILAELERKRITHVILRLGGSGNSALYQTVRRWPERFQNELTNRMFTIYRFVAPDAAAGTTYPPCLH